MVLLAKALGMSKEEGIHRGVVWLGGPRTRLVGARCAWMRRSVVRLAQRALWRSKVSHAQADGDASGANGPVMPLATQESQRPLELALSQPTLGSLERQEVALAQLPGTPLELGSSRRDQRRRSSALSAASSLFGSSPLPAVGRQHGGDSGWAVTPRCKRMVRSALDRRR
jgi:hypothetical protein